MTMIQTTGFALLLLSAPVLSQTATVPSPSGLGPQPAAGRVAMPGGASSPAGGPLAASVGCEPNWIPTFGGNAALNGAVRALVVHDDGSGSALFAAGDFTTAGGAPANRIAKWDGAAWSPLGAGLSGPVHALASFDDGSGPALYAAGQFLNSGGVTMNRIARWDGGSWSPLAQGVNGTVNALEVYDDGSGPALYVGGEFGVAGGVSASRIARWNGTGWSALGTGVTGTGAPSIQVLATFEGELYAAGLFTVAGGIGADRIARWNGAAWQPLGTGVLGEITALGVHDDGSGPALFVGGFFFEAGGLDVEHVARWRGGAWHKAGLLPYYPLDFHSYDPGTGPQLYAGVESPIALRRWTGNGWTTVQPNTGNTYPSGYEALATFDQPGVGPALIAAASFAQTPAGDTFIALFGGCAGALGEPYCFGDGSGAACPCGNVGGPGEGCAHSGGGGVALGASGSSSLAANELHFDAAGIPAGAPAQLFVGSAAPGSGLGVPFGDGLRCSGGQVVRLAVRIADTQGEASWGPTHPQSGGWSAGTTRYFQVRYRDVAGPCSSGFNSSSAYSIALVP